MLERMHHPLAQQGQSGSAVHRSFDQLQLGMLPLGLRVALWSRQPGEHRRFVLLNAVHEALQLLDLAGSGLRQPVVQVITLPLVEQLAKRLDQGRERLGRWIRLAEGREGLALVGLEIGRIADQQPDRLLGRGQVVWGSLRWSRLHGSGGSTQGGEEG
jgi:hypothetical protein